MTSPTAERKPEVKATNVGASLIATAETLTQTKPAHDTHGLLSRMALLLHRMKRAPGVMSSRRMPKLPPSWVRGQLVGQTQSEFLARMTPDVVAADWERRRMSL